MKVCPKCRRTWPDSGRFCPMDGTPLVEMKGEGREEPFSETKWFKAGDVVKDDDLGPEVLTQAQLEEHYRATGELPEEVRKRYSMRYGTPEDRAGAKKDDE